MKCDVISALQQSLILSEQRVQLLQAEQANVAKVQGMQPSEALLLCEAEARVAIERTSMEAIESHWMELHLALGDAFLRRSGASLVDECCITKCHLLMEALASPLEAERRFTDLFFAAEAKWRRDRDLLLQGWDLEVGSIVQCACRMTACVIPWLESLSDKLLEWHDGVALSMMKEGMALPERACSRVHEMAEEWAMHVAAQGCEFAAAMQLRQRDAGKGDSGGASNTSVLASAWRKAEHDYQARIAQVECMLEDRDQQLKSCKEQISHLEQQLATAEERNLVAQQDAQRVAASAFQTQSAATLQALAEMQTQLHLQSRQLHETSERRAVVELSFAAVAGSMLSIHQSVAASMVEAASVVCDAMIASSASLLRGEHPTTAPNSMLAALSPTGVCMESVAPWLFAVSCEFKQDVMGRALNFHADALALQARTCSSYKRLEMNADAQTARVERCSIVEAECSHAKTVAQWLLTESSRVVLKMTQLAEEAAQVMNDVEQVPPDNSPTD